MAVSSTSVALAPDLVGLVVHLEVGEDAAGRCRPRPGPRPAQHGVDAGHQLVEAEGLGHVVVAAGGEPAHLVLGGVAGRQEQHRRPVALGPHAAGTPRCPSTSGSMTSRRTRSWRPRSARVMASPPVAATSTANPSKRRAAPEQVGDVGLVVDHQDPGDVAHPHMIADAGGPTRRPRRAAGSGRRRAVPGPARPPPRTQAPATSPHARPTTSRGAEPRPRCASTSWTCPRPGPRTGSAPRSTCPPCSRTWWTISIWKP